MRRNQPEARAELFRRYAPQVRRILYLQGLCEEIDDAVQEVFIKVFQRRSCPAEEAFLGWFYRVILNTGRDMGRRRKTRFGLLDRCSTSPSPRTRSRPSPAIRRCAPPSPALPPSCARQWRCASSPTCSLEEIAQTQDVPVGTVKSRLHTAMSRLRAALGETKVEHG